MVTNDFDDYKREKSIFPRAFISRNPVLANPPVMDWVVVSNKEKTGGFFLPREVAEFIIENMEGYEIIEADDLMDWIENKEAGE